MEWVFKQGFVEPEMFKFKLLNFVTFWRSVYFFSVLKDKVLEISSNILTKLLLENVITNLLFFVW